MITHTCKLNMCPCGKTEIIRLNQQDDDVKIVFDLYASDGEFSFASGTTVACLGRRKDGYPIEVSASFTGEKQVTVDVSADMGAVEGTGIYELEFNGDGKLMHSQNFKVHFYRSANQDGGGDG